MPFGKGRRKLARVFGFILLGLVAIWFSTPIWFQWILRPLASREGAGFSSCAREGYLRFSLSGFGFTNESVIIRAGRVEALVPNFWLAKLVGHRSADSASFITVENWECQLLPETNGTSSVYSTLQDAADTFRLLKQWVPQASLVQGTVRIETNAFSIPKATWHEGILDAGIKLLPHWPVEAVEATLSQTRPFLLQIAAPTYGLDSTFTISTNRSGFEVNGSTIWRSNRVELQATFDTVGTLPVTGSVRAVNFRIPAGMLKLPGYDQISGSLSAQWDNGKFGLDLAASGRPTSDQTNLPPIQVELHSSGNTNSATIERLMVLSPFLQASLSNKVTVSLSAPFLLGEANLDLSADLSRQQLAAVTGTLTGSAAVTSGPDNLLVARVHLVGTDLGFTDLRAHSVEVSAHFAWPLAELDRVDLRFDDGSTGTASGKFDLEKRSANDGRFQFQGPLMRRWLPTGYSYGDLLVTGTFGGPIEKPAHAGRIEVKNFDTPFLKPIAVTGQWSGLANTVDRFDLSLIGTNTSLTTQGSATLDPKHTDLKLKALSLFTNQASALEISEPLTVSVSTSTANPGVQLVTGPLHWFGPGGEIKLQTTVQWPREGLADLSLQNLSLSLLNGFTRTNLPQIGIRRLEVRANWTNGPIIFSVDASGSGIPRSTIDSQILTSPKAPSGPGQTTSERILATPLTFELKLQGDARGVVISNLSVKTSTSDVVAVQGFLPIKVTPSTTANLMSLDQHEPLNVRASLRPEAFFWEEVFAVLGARLVDPRLDLTLTGTWSAPEGRITFGARSIQLKQAKSTPLALNDLRLDLDVNAEVAHLREGKLLVQGQPVSITGELPLGSEWWSRLKEKRPPDWTKASARLRVQQAKLADFEPLFPEILGPQGMLDVDIELLPGVNFTGAMVLRNARTRPLGNIAPIRNINATVRFHERSLVLENATASLSGAALTLSGDVDMRGTNWMSGELPPFHMIVNGTNVPLARSSEYIVRSDLDLKVDKTNGAPPVVFGTAHLRDSFFLSDLGDLTPGKVASSSERPPYFSIDDPAVADWQLAITVEGLRWLRLRTSLFNGEVSANLHLQGTLKDPIAIGGLKVDSGLVRFPFANFQVQQGLVTLASQDPYHPQLLVRATSKQFGYDLRLEVTGAADSPIIQFTSNPSLSSEQILLMITAGQLPQGAYTLTPQQRAQTVALFLGRDLLSKLGYGDQSKERLTINSGEEVSEQGRPTYHVEYKLTDRWSLEGEYDRFGDFNAGFKWRIYSK